MKNNKNIKVFLSLFFIFTNIIPNSYSSEYITVGNYPCIGLTLESVDGVGILGDRDKGGYGVFGDIGIKLNCKLVNELYLRKKFDDFYPVTANWFNVYAFSKIKDRFFVGSDNKESYKENVFETQLGGGLYLEIPFLEDDEKFALFLEPNVGYDFSNNRTEINLYAGANLIDINWKQLNFQGNFGAGVGGVINDGKYDFNDLMIFFGCKLNHNFNHSRYYKIAEEYKNKAIQKKKAYEEYLSRKREEEQKKYDSYKLNYTIYENYLYPLLLGKSAKVTSLRGSNPNFVKNSPYSFDETCYYSIESYAGEVLQWLDKETVLFSFRETQYYGYGSTFSGLAYIHFNSNITSFPFDKSDVIYRYTGVYDYITANGSLNTVPKFEAVFSVGNY